jgi:hypothetical protein
MDLVNGVFCLCPRNLSDLIKRRCMTINHVALAYGELRVPEALDQAEQVALVFDFHHSPPSFVKETTTD